MGSSAVGGQGEYAGRGNGPIPACSERGRGVSMGPRKARGCVGGVAATTLGPQMRVCMTK